METACKTSRSNELPDKDCHYITLLKAHHDIEKALHQKSGLEKRILAKYLKSIDEKIEAATEKAECFPAMCDTCPGLAKCLECKHQNICSIKTYPPVM